MCVCVCVCVCVCGVCVCVVCVCEDSMFLSGVNFMKTPCDKSEVCLCSSPDSANTSAGVAQAVPTVCQSMDGFYFICAVCVVRQLSVVAKFETCIWIGVIRTNKMHFSLLIHFSNHPLHVSNTLKFHHQEVSLLYMQHLVFIVLKVY